MNRRSAIILLILILVAAAMIFLQASLQSVNAGLMPEAASTTPRPSATGSGTPFIPVGEENGRFPLTDPVDCATLPPPVVGFEISKGQIPQDVMGFLSALEADGFSVGTVDLSGGPIPACVAVLWIQGLAQNSFLTANYSASEAALLQSWVASGHGLLAGGDWGPFKASTQAIFQAFGYLQMGSNTGVVSDPTDSDPAAPPVITDTWVIYQPDNFAPHPLYANVGEVEFLRSSWLAATPSAILTTDGDASPAQVPGMAAGSVGNGCVILTADSNWLSQYDNAYLKKDNLLAGRQSVAWLVDCAALSVSKTADPDPVSPGATLLYTMTVSTYEAAPLTGLVVRDVVPPQTSFVGATAPYSGPDGNGLVTWPLGALSGSSTTVITMLVQVNGTAPHGALITNTVAVDSNEGLTATAAAVVHVLSTVPTAVAGGPYTVNEGSTVILNGSSSTDPQNLPLVYAWDFDNDGQFDDATGVTPAFSAALLDDGVYPIVLQVDNGISISSDSSTVTVLNVAPQVALAASTWNTLPGQPITFTGTVTDPGGLDTHSNTWTFGDASPISNGALLTSHVYVSPGQYTIVLTVTDDDGGVGQDFGVVTIELLAPTAVAGGPYSVNEGSSIPLDGSGSSDPNGFPLSYAWDFDGDGLFDDAIGAAPLYSAMSLDDGSYPVGLLVSNGFLTATDFVSVTVLNVAPDVTLLASSWSVPLGQAITFTGSFTDPGVGDTHTAVWDFGDGTPAATGPFVSSYVYTTPGAYTVTVTISDDDGGVGQAAGLVLVEVLAPTAVTGGPYNVNEGSSLSLNASGSSDPNGLPLSYAWDFDGDGLFDDAVGPIPTFSAALLDDAVLPIGLLVSNGILSDTAVTAVTVQNVAPQVTLTASTWQITTGQAITFTGLYTDPGVLDTHSGMWDFGDGLLLAGLPLQVHVELTNGMITVALSVEEGAKAAVAPALVAGQLVTFTAVMSDPGVLDTHTAVWNFGDGTVPTSGWLVTTHTYSSSGPFTASITLTDDDGGVGYDGHTIQITAPPVPPQFVYLPFAAHDACYQSIYTSDIILALDRSSSMDLPTAAGGMSKYAAAQAAATEFLHLLQFPGDQAGIVSFANDAVLEHPLSDDVDSLIQALHVERGGPTWFDLALRESRQELVGPRHIPGNKPVIILLTDGVPNGADEATVLAEAAQAKAQGITIYTIGLGVDVNAALLQAMATTPQHYYPAPATDDLNTIYAQIAHSVNCAAD
ncbi:MAG: PKD domain-containing protein [Ardenticatenaceae bacterium]|nr:PKD domain-containing protein [Ardenticatenaceae bacterium]